jgi:murein DD-endopeptidase MepM/ murein hydrolase activator NlpD
VLPCRPLAPPSTRWLSLRVRLLCSAAFAVSTLLPVYVPADALAGRGEGQQELARATQFLFSEDGFLLKTSPLSHQAVRRTLTDGTVVTVEAGQTVASLAKTYGLREDTIRWANNLSSDAKLTVGQELLILPTDGILHLVTRGQTLPRIAELYGMPVEVIAQQNRIEEGFIIAGQQLIIPGGRPIFGGASQVAFSLPQFSTQKSSAPSTVTRPTSPATTTASTRKDQVPAATASPTSGALQSPCENCLITQYFHEGHYALDMAASGGGPIFAAEGGTVIEAENDGGWHGGYGNVIRVDHGDGMVTLYAHNKEVYVNVGDTVERGQTIAWMGRTGRVYGVTGIHVHFEVSKDGQKRNPLLYLR